MGDPRRGGLVVLWAILLRRAGKHTMFNILIRKIPLQPLSCSHWHEIDLKFRRSRDIIIVQETHNNKKLSLASRYCFTIQYIRLPTKKNNWVAILIREGSPFQLTSSYIDKQLFCIPKSAWRGGWPYLLQLILPQCQLECLIIKTAP